MRIWGGPAGSGHLACSALKGRCAGVSGPVPPLLQVFAQLSPLGGVPGTDPAVTRASSPPAPLCLPSQHLFVDCVSLHWHAGPIWVGLLSFCSLLGPVCTGAQQTLWDGWMDGWMTGPRQESVTHNRTFCDAGNVNTCGMSHVQPHVQHFQCGQCN